MKTKRLAFVLAVVMLVSLSAPVFASSNPFADVPADHWAYDAIIQLAAVGLVEGYPDGTYGGSRMLTRYEAAMVFARTLARLEALVDEGVAKSTAGVREQITADVLKDIEAAKESLTQLIMDELAKIEIPVVESETIIVEQPIEKIVERQPIEVERPFQMTPEAEAIIAERVAELAKKHLAEAEDLARQAVVETKIIERVVEVEVEGAVDEDLVRAIAEELLAESLKSVEARLFDAEIDISNLQFGARVTNERIALAEDQIATLEAALSQRIGDLEKGQDALAGDIAYVESRLLGLIEGVRRDVAAVQAALDSEVASLVDSIDDLRSEFEVELAMLGIRVEKLERLYVENSDRITDVELDLAALKDQVAYKSDIERVQFTGSLESSVKRVEVLDVADPDNPIWMPDRDSNMFEDEYESGVTFSQDVDLTLTVKATEDVTVKANFGGGFDMDEQLVLDELNVELTSSTPLRRLEVGLFGEDHVEDRFSSYVLNAVPEFGVLADLNLVGLEAEVVYGREPGVPDDLDVAALSARYAFIPELGVKGAFGVQFGQDRMEQQNTAALVGAFGTIYDVNYDVSFGLDLEADDENSIIDVQADAEFGPLALSAKWAQAEDNYGLGDGTGNPLIDRGFVEDAGATRLELGAGLDIFEIELDVTLYNETDNNDVELVKASMIELSRGFDLVLPFTISAKVGRHDQAVVNDHLEAKIAVEDFEVGNLTMGASFAHVQNLLLDGWKDAANWSGRDVNIVTADLGYVFAEIDLGYGLKLAMPHGDTADDFNNELTHKFSAGYSFSDDLKLTLDAKQVTWSTLDAAGDVDDDYKVNEIKAGLNFSF